MAGETIADYPEAMARIAENHVSPDSTTQDEVYSDVRGADAPQVTQKVAQNLKEAIVTEEKAREFIEATGEIPSDAEMEFFADAADDYDLPDRVDAVADALREEVATVEDIQQAVETRQEQTEQMFRENVESAVESVEQSKDLVGESREEVVSRQAQEIGAPRESDVREASVQASMPDDAVTPADRGDLSSDSATPINIIEDSSGDPIGAFGGASQGGVSPEETAEELGVDYLGSATEVADQFDVEGTGSTVDLTLSGRKVSEVDVV